MFTRALSNAARVVAVAARQGFSHSLTVSSASLQFQLRARTDIRRRYRSREGSPQLGNSGGADVGSMPLNFAVIPVSRINMRMESQLESFLKKQEKETLELGTSAESPKIRLLNVPRTTLKRAVLDFNVRGQQVRAVGQSRRGKVAKALCCMHAAMLIDHFSIDGVGCHDMPLPLEEEGVSSVPSNAAQTPHHKHAQGSPLSTTLKLPPPWAPGMQWERYVSDCENYIRRREQQERTDAYVQLRVPRSGNPLVDRAADMTKGEKHINHLALQRLNNEIRNATKDIHITRVSRRIFVATLLLDDTSQLSATGVATSLKEAKQRCAMHALNILKLIKDQRLASSPLASVCREGSSTSAISSSLSPRYSKMLDFFTLLCGVKPKPSFTKDGRGYKCELLLDDVTSTGRGVNRFEAERDAIEHALSEMELYDERLQAINSIISRYPKIQPQCVPSAKLPESLRNAIHALVQRVHKELHLADDGTTLTGSKASSSKDENKSDDTDDVVDAETRATINALEEISRDEAYANRLRDRLCTLRADPKYLERYHARRSSLSINAVSQSILNELQQNRVVVVCGTTGCGKTTQVPQYILDAEIMAGRGDQCCIVVTQPRRLSAFSVAERIASERLSAVGGDVGYAVRLDARPGRHVTLCTTGVLLQMLVGMPSLDAVSHLVIDEVHERDINCDVLLALVKDLMESGRNPRLKVVLMSATMQSDMFASYFGRAPVISVEGATYPVEVRYLDDVAALLQKQTNTRNAYYSTMFDSLTAAGGAGEVGRRRKGAANRGRSGFGAKKQLLSSPLKTDYSLIAQLVRRSVEVDLNNDVFGKSVLVFLPGWKELVAAKQAIEGLGDGQRYHIILLHSCVDAAKQRECFAPAPVGKVKVVLATNIAESGITIDDAAVVIDTGLIKQTTWVSRVSGLQQQGRELGILAAPMSTTYATQLSLRYASQANCTQRKGRAGRTQGGVCYRLFVRDVWDVLPAFQEAEIHRVPLTQVLLKLLALGHDRPKEKLRTFIEPPSEKNVEDSMRQLQSLGAVSADERLTPLGLYLSRLPCEPTVAKMIMMGAVLRCLDSALTMAATGDVNPFLSSRDMSFEVRVRRRVFAMGSQSDHISVLNAYNAYSARRADAGFAKENFLSANNMRLISRYKQQYRDILQRSGFIRDTELNSPQFTSECGSFGGDGSHVLYFDDGPLSADATDVSLVKACLCAALFPNVAVLDPTPLLQQQGKKAKTLVMRTSTRSAISPSKDSACRRTGSPQAHTCSTPQDLFSPHNDEHMDLPSMLYIYQGIFSLKESREEFLTQVSSVSLWALLLFGVGEADMHYDNQVHLCVVGNWIGIHMDSESYKALVAIRTILHACVWRKYKHPEDPGNNRALEELHRICKGILKSPPNDKEQYLNNLVDTGRIFSPMEVQQLTDDVKMERLNGEQDDDGNRDVWELDEV